MKKSILKRSMSLFLALIMCFTTLAGFSTTVSAAGEKGTSYLVSFPRSNDANLDYSGTWGHDEIELIGGWRIQKTRYTTFFTIDKFGGPICYCIEPGTLIENGYTYTQKDETYWDNYPDLNPTIEPDTIKLLIGRIMQYGFTGEVSLTWVSQNAEDAKKIAQAYATQILVWETIAGERDENFQLVDVGDKSRATDIVGDKHPLRTLIFEYYNDIVSKVQQHIKLPEFCAKAPNKSQEFELKWDGSQYIATLTDANGVLSNYTFSSSNPDLTFSVSGNTLTVATKNAPDGIVTIQASKKDAQRKGMVVWSDGKISPGDGQQDIISYTQSVNDPVQGFFKVKVSYGSAKIVKTSEDGKVDGVSFRIQGNGVDQTVQTKDGGQIEIQNLLPGVYTVTELTEDKYEPQESRRVTVVSGQTSTVTFNNTLKRGDLKVVKSSEDQFREGITFHLSGSSLAGIPVDEYAVTDQSGVALFDDVPIGSGYLLEEMDVPNRYVVPDSQIVEIQWDEVTEQTFENILKKFTAIVTKSDSEKGLPQGDATLKDAVYGVYNNGQLVDTYRTDENGSFTTKEYTCGDNWTIREITPSKGYLLDETVHEIGADPEHYTVEHNAVAIDVGEDIIKGSISLIKHTDDGSTQIETPEEGAVFNVYLKSAGSYDAAKETERDTLVCDEHGYAKSKDLPYGTYVVEQVSGWEGTELIAPFEIEISKDGFEYKYLINNAQFASYIKIVKKDAESGKIIPAADTGFQLYHPDGSLVEMTLTYPTVETIDTFYTNSEGFLVTPQPLPYGKGYSCVEVSAPDGYVLNSDPVFFDITQENSTKEDAVTIVLVEKLDTAQKGVIEINKEGEVFWSVEESDGTYQPVYLKTGVPGSVFAIYADEDIYTPDGTLRSAKGTLEDTIESDENGIAVSKELYLGRYKIVEIQAAPGTVLDSTPLYAKLSYAGQEIPLTSTSVYKTNQRQKVNIRLSKRLEEDTLLGLGSKKEFANISFGLFAAETLTAADGKTIPQDGMLESVTVQENGSITFQTDLPFGDYYIRELSTDPHYQISSEKIPVHFEYAGENTVVVDIDLGTIENKLIRGSAVTTKYDKDYPDNKLSDAVFHVYADINGNKTYDADTDVYIGTMEENETGIYRLDNLPAFGYFLYEAEAPEGFVKDNGYHYFEITANGETVQVSNDGGEGFSNQRITGTAAVKKVDASNSDITLTGAIFDVYEDTDADGVYTEGVDMLIGEMEETETGVYQIGNLVFGIYFLHERQAPDSFIRDDRYYAFVIDTNGKTVWIENEAGVGFTNQPETPDTPEEEPDRPNVSENPDTGDRGISIWWFVPVGAAAAALIIFAVVRKKHNNKK